MTAATAQQSSRVRTNVVIVLVVHGIIGLLLMLGVTWIRRDDPAAVFTLLGDDAPRLLAIFFVYSGALAVLRFALTKLTYVSLSITSFMAMIPLLGMIPSAWIGVSSVALARLLTIHRLLPFRASVEDTLLEYAKLFALTATYGIPIIAGGAVYETLGGVTPVIEFSAASVVAVIAGSVAIIVTNNLIMATVELAWGYAPSKSLQLALIDASIYGLGMPFVLCLVYSYGAMGWEAVLLLCFSGIVANAVGRNLAITRSRTQQQLQRLASISEIGRLISIEFTTEELLSTIYTECRKVIDVSIFSIALIDENAGELTFAFEIRDGQRLPRSRLPLGEGLNSWVLEIGRPLRLGSLEEERKIGLQSVSDEVETESWLGVPMIARDRVIGVLSVQSYRKNAFSSDDEVMLSAIANQAAIALENAALYRDLEGLTVALEHRVEERTHELEDANLRLMAADRSKNQFLANMSHELRTPLNSILGFSTILLENTQTYLEPKLYRFLENIRGSGRHLLSLINDILDLAKIQAGRLSLDLERVDVVHVLEDAIAECDLLAEKRVGVDLEPGETRCEAKLDPVRLKQVVGTLLRRAAAASRPGDRIVVRIAERTAAESALHVDSIVVQVEDHGAPISEHDQRHLFDEFFQPLQVADPALRETGLALALVRRLVALHQGAVTVRSDPETTLFELLLPRRLHLSGESIEAPVETSG